MLVITCFLHDSKLVECVCLVFQWRSFELRRIVRNVFYWKRKFRSGTSKLWRSLSIIHEYASSCLLPVSSGDDRVSFTIWSESLHMVAGLYKRWPGSSSCRLRRRFHVFWAFWTYGQCHSTQAGICVVDGWNSANCPIQEQNRASLQELPDDSRMADLHFWHLLLCWKRTLVTAVSSRVA